jgi:hypothetical protein
VLRVRMLPPGVAEVTTTDLNEACVYALAVNGTDLYAGTEGGVFRSTNGGANWTSENEGLTTSEVLALAVKGSNLFAGTKGGRLYLSEDKGDTWTPVDSGLGGEDILSFATSGNSLFAGTGGGGVYLTSNNGASWSHVNEGLGGIIYSLTIADGDLYAGTHGSSVWRRPLSEMITSAERISGEHPSVYALSRNYPNPFNPTTKIHFTIVNRHLTRVNVFDLLGRTVATLVNEVKAPGTYTVEFDGSDLPSGVYFYRLQAGNFAQTRKMMLLA